MCEKMIRVTAPHFCAGAVFKRSKKNLWFCVTAAPILYWMVGKEATTDLTNYFNRKGWSFEVREVKK